MAETREVQLREKRFSLPRLALKYPQATIVVTGLMIALGVYSYLTVPERMVPRIPSPNIGVVTLFPGMPAEDMERYITRPLEKRIQIVGGINYMLGVSQEGYSKIVVYFDYDVDLERKRAEMKNLLDVIANELPRAGANTTVPRVVHVDRQNNPLIQFAVRREGYDRTRLKELLDNVILTEFQLIDGVLSAWTFGGPVRQIQVVVDRDKLAAYDIPILAVRNAIDNANFSRGGGQLFQGPAEEQIVIPNEYTEGEILHRLPRLPIAEREGRIIYLGDVARVEDTHAPLYGDFFYNGEPAIWLGVQPEADKDFYDIAGKAKKLAKSLEREYPGLKFDVVFDKTYYMGLNDQNAQREFLLAVILASLVMLLFLGEVSTTLIAAAILPASVAFGFFMLSVLGFQKDFGINMGLIFIVGKLVDDSIIVIENIRRYIEHGVKPRLAATAGAEEVQNAVAAATLSFVVMLIPMTQMTGDMGSGFRSMTIPMITTVLTSWFMAMTLTPLMAAHFFKPKPGVERSPLEVEAETELSTEAPPGRLGALLWKYFLRYFVGLANGLGRFVAWSLDRPLLILGGAAASLIFALGIYDKLGQEQMPLTDTSLVLGYMRAAPGTSPERMYEITKEVARIALQEPHVKGASALVGQSPVWGQFFTGYGVNTRNEAQWIMNLTIADKRDRKKHSLWAIEERIRTEAKRRIPELDVLFFQPMAPTPVAAARAPVEVLVKGKELDQTYRYGREILRIAKTQGRGVHSVYLDAVYGVPQWKIEIDEERAEELGVEPAQIIGQVYYALNGGMTDVFFNPDPMYYHSRLFIKFDDAQRQWEGDIGNIPISVHGGGRQVPLRSLARVTRTVGYDRIHSYNTLYAASVLGYYKELGLKETTMSIMMPSKMQIALPKGYVIGPAGLMGTMLQAFNELNMGLKIALFAVFLVLVVQFKSFGVGLVNMAAIPLIAIGSLGALWLRGMSWSPPVLWGLVILSGIVLTDSVVILDKIEHLRSLGFDLRKAIVRASVLRLRPVLMTAITTGIAMAPIAIWPPPMTEQFRNIATGITGGLLTSTVMTLIVIPVSYFVMVHVRAWLIRFYTEERVTLRHLFRPIEEPALAANPGNPGHPGNPEGEAGA